MITKSAPSPHNSYYGRVALVGPRLAERMSLSPKACHVAHRDKQVKRQNQFEASAGDTDALRRSSYSWDRGLAPSIVQHEERCFQLIGRGFQWRSGLQHSDKHQLRSCRSVNDFGQRILAEATVSRDATAALGKLGTIAKSGVGWRWKGEHRNDACCRYIHVSVCRGVCTGFPSKEIGKLKNSCRVGNMHVQFASSWKFAVGLAIWTIRSEKTFFARNYVLILSVVQSSQSCI